MRVIVMILALLGGLGSSQAPEFAQQYVQRLGGAVDELARIVSAFDDDAGDFGLNRAEALEELEGLEGFAGTRAARMEQAIRRYERLREHLKGLQTQPSSAWPMIIATRGDRAIMSATAEDFAPAAPITVSGAGYGLAGAVLSGGLLWLIVSGISRMMRRKRRRTA